MPSGSGTVAVASFGSGQLLVYDTKRKTRIGLYDLPDRASAPYAVTWDPVRKVVWIPTSNADAIYRFDPKTASFGVLPMPRGGAYLRMIDVDPPTGRLITSYANIVEQAHGPRMALVIDPGDGAYDRASGARTTRAARATTAATAGTAGALSAGAAAAPSPGAAGSPRPTGTDGAARHRLETNAFLENGL